MDYTALVTAIQDYAQNDETTFVSHLNDFIITAEDRIFTRVQMPAFFKSTSGTNTVDGTSEYSVDGMLDVFSIRVSETAGDADGPYRYLLKKDYDFLLEAYPGASTGVDKGIPEYYAVSSAGVASGSADPKMTVRFGPIPGAAYPYVIDYYGKMIADSITSGVESGGTSTNKTWLSVTAPETLLYGALVEAYTYMKGSPDLVTNYEKHFNESVDSLKALVEGRTLIDAYRSGQKQTRIQ